MDPWAGRGQRLRVQAAKAKLGAVIVQTAEAATAILLERWPPQALMVTCDSLNVWISTTRVTKYLKSRQRGTLLLSL